MSIGIAMARIGEYSGALERATAKHAEVQDLLEAAALRGENAPPELRKEMAKLSLLMGLYKEFIEFWKQVIKDFLALLKSVNELASGAR